MAARVPAVMLVAGDARYRKVRDRHGRKCAYGTVFICIDRLTNTTVAVKRQPIPNATSELEFAAYIALRRCPHANVQCMLDHFVTEDARGSWLSTVHDFV